MLNKVVLGSIIILCLVSKGKLLYCTVKWEFLNPWLLSFKYCSCLNSLYLFHESYYMLEIFTASAMSLSIVVSFILNISFDLTLVLLISNLLLNSSMVFLSLIECSNEVYGFLLIVSSSLPKFGFYLLQHHK